MYKRWVCRSNVSNQLKCRYYLMLQALLRRSHCTHTSTHGTVVLLLFFWNAPISEESEAHWEFLCTVNHAFKCALHAKSTTLNLAQWFEQNTHTESQLCWLCRSVSSQSCTLFVELQQWKRVKRKEQLCQLCTKQPCTKHQRATHLELRHYSDRSACWVDHCNGDSQWLVPLGNRVFTSESSWGFGLQLLLRRKLWCTWKKFEPKFEPSLKIRTKIRTPNFNMPWTLIDALNRALATMWLGEWLVFRTHMKN